MKKLIKFIKGLLENKCCGCNNGEFTKGIACDTCIGQSNYYNHSSVDIMS